MAWSSYPLSGHVRQAQRFSYAYDLDEYWHIICFDEIILNTKKNVRENLHLSSLGL
jgi:hypothetical protein